MVISKATLAPFSEATSHPGISWVAISTSSSNKSVGVAVERYVEGAVVFKLSDLILREALNDGCHGFHFTAQFFTKGFEIGFDAFHQAGVIGRYRFNFFDVYFRADEFAHVLNGFFDFGFIGWEQDFL